MTCPVIATGLRKEGAPMPGLNGPLDGIRVLDLGRYQAGPRCGLMFARLGAEVIKVERPQGDESRANGPFVRGQSAYWVQYNSGKKSLALELRSEEGKEVLRDLVKVSDVLIQNFRPGIIDVMGFGYDALRALNKRIIMVNVSAYGQYGPYRDRVGFDPIGQAMSGLMSITGQADGPPTRTAATIIDRVTALHATIGALAALREREVSGEGQAIDVCLADTGYTLMEIPLAAYLGEGIMTDRGDTIGGAAPSNAYECRDGWVFIIALAEDMWLEACKAMGRTDWLNDPGLKTRAGRVTRRDEVEAGVAEWCAGRTVQEVVDACVEVGVPVSPVNDIPGAAKDPHLLDRDILMEVPDHKAGTIHVAGKMVKFSRTEMVVGTTPDIGEHSEGVLRDVLGYDAGRIEALRQSKAL